MRPRERSYRCVVCRWRGRMEPIDAGDAAPCPQCGVYLYPLSQGKMWAVALLIMAATAGMIGAVAAWM